MSRAIYAALIAGGLAFPAFAQDSGSSQSGDDAAAQEQAQAEDQQQDQQAYITASMIQDARIVSLEGNYDSTVWEGEEPFAAMLADLSEIGEVEEIVMDNQGQVQGLTTDVGGFLGIGDKAVMIPLSDIRLARSPDDDDELSIVTRLDREALENQPAFEIDD
ncbi:PRC-barrel domain-containing protein [Roseivivax marinus]|uniref:PRC-barrel domain-containing protein n=1 Tax=Roseivivax marinus TaxID=1379903 RepID=UPI0008D6C487|nr:PRC-barrel domain-containing protein [Roseivivax marinus]SEL87180.1 PRC-barrel domain-containing protein [Roseivivax marinus]